MSNILVFAREIIPYCNSVGSSLRAVTLCRHLADAGHSVTLLGAKGIYVSDFGLGNLIEGLDIIYVEDMLQKYYTNKAAINISNIESIVSEPTIKNNSEWLRKFKFVIKKFIIDGVKKFIIPDLSIIFLPKFIFQSLKLIRDRKINILIVSSPPHSSQILTLFARLCGPKGLEIIVDYRDGWNTFEIFKPKYKLGAILSRYLEKKVLLSCDQFLYQSPKVLSDIVNEFNLKGLIEQKSTLVRNGYTETLSDQSNSHYKVIDDSCRSIKLGYFGGIDFADGSWRNPSRFLNMLDSVGIFFELVIYGQPIEKSLIPKYKNINISLKGVVDLPVAKKVMVGFDALFVFHSTDAASDEVVPGKFYEYLQASRPILVCGPPLMECGLLVEEYNFGIFIRSTSSQEDVIESISCLLDGKKITEYVDSIKLNSHEFSRAFQYNKIKFRNLEI